MTNNEHTLFSQNSVSPRLQQPEVLTTQQRVRQDNPAPPRERAASPQPVTVEKDARTHQKNTKTSRSQKHYSSKRKTVPAMFWLKPGVKAELERIAQQKGLSMSATGAAFLEHALQQNLYTQHTAMLDPIIDKAIGKHMRRYSSRIALLLVRVAFDTGQIRGMVTNILSRHPDLAKNPTLLNAILDGSSKTAKRNITKRTPQLETIIEELEQLFTEAEGGEKG